MSLILGIELKFQRISGRGIFFTHSIKINDYAFSSSSNLRLPSYYNKDYNRIINKPSFG
jgi:hypothetical protein